MIMELRAFLLCHPEFSFLISSIGLFLAIIGILRIKRQQRKDKIVLAFSKVCRIPITELFSYKELYSRVHAYLDLKGFPELIAPDKSYFQHCINRPAVMFDNQQSELLRFPLISKKAWVRSSSPSLRIIEKSLDFSPDNKEDMLKKKSRRFLRYFGAESLASFLIHIGKKIWDAKTFDLQSVDESTSLIKLSFSLGSYFNYVNRYEAIARELFFELYNDKFHICRFGRIRRLLPNKSLIRSVIYRSKTKNLDSTVFRFATRPAKLGISTFVIMKKEDNRYCTFVQKRGETQVEYPGIYHVAPAGTFQPLSDFDATTISDQFSFSYTILREFLEEVYGLEEADTNKSVDPFNIFRLPVSSGSIPGEILFNGEVKGDKIPNETTQYRIVPTGLFVDLISMKPELTAVLWIKNADLYTKTKVSSNWEGQVKEYDLDSSPFNHFLDRYLNISSFLPAGAASIAEGIKFYTEEVRGGN